MRGSRWIVPALGAVLVLPLLPSPSAAGGSPPPLPECRYDDVRTRYRDPSEWRITLVDPILRLPRAYEPPGLVSVARAGLAGGRRVRAKVIDDLRALARDARRADAPIVVMSGYRSFATQRALFDDEVRIYGYDVALRQVARPGHSEHQLGTALDFRSAGSQQMPWNHDDWGTTPAGAWLAANGWRYGFVMTYPKGMRAETCYRYEPWHYRYVGREMAAAVHDSGQTLRRYLWDDFETAPG